MGYNNKIHTFCFTEVGYIIRWFIKIYKLKILYFVDLLVNELINYVLLNYLCKHMPYVPMTFLVYLMWKEVLFSNEYLTHFWF